MDFKNSISFETDLPIEKVADIISKSISAMDAKAKKNNLGNGTTQLILWHFNHKQSLMTINLMFTPNFPLKWLLSINTEIPIEFNVSGDYKTDEKNVEELTINLCNSLKKSTPVKEVKRYSSAELKKFGIG